MLRILDFPAEGTVSLVEADDGLQAETVAEIDSLWRTISHGVPLFDGKIVSAIEVTTHGIVGRIVDYRRLSAQLMRPSLFGRLNVRPVAVSGILQCADGIVFGLRSSGVLTARGKWELAPSGGIDSSNGICPGPVDYRLQLLRELREELGIDANLVSRLDAFCVVEDSQTHVVDIGVAMATHLDAEAICIAHARFATSEYSELKVFQSHVAVEYLEALQVDVLPTSKLILARFQERYGEA